MGSKAFVSLLLSALILGGGLGGAFVGGIALGKSQAQEQQPASNSTPGQAPGGLGNSFVRGMPGAGFSPLNGAFGTIEKVEGNTLTITTPQGPVTINLTEDTSIRVTSKAAPEDLKPGMQVAVVGDRKDDGSLNARTIQAGEVGTGIEVFGGGQPRGSGGGDGGRVPGDKFESIGPKADIINGILNDPSSIPPKVSR